MILTHGANSLKVEDDSKVTIGGRDYPVVKIGNQLWIAENLDYKFDVNGSQIPIGGSDQPTTPHAWYYNNDEASYGIDGTYKCGLMYNWYAADYLEQNKSTLLPDGWHVPSKTEWQTLLTTAGGDSIALPKIKALDNSITSNWPSQWNGTDDYGFKLLPGGSGFSDIGSRTNLWTATVDDSSYAWLLDIWSSTIGFYISQKYNRKYLRLVKDST